MLCGTECVSATIRDRNTKFRKPVEELRVATFTCEVCGNEKTIAASRMKKGNAKFCSNRCRGLWCASDEKTIERCRRIAATGRPAWTESSAKGHREKMSGSNNPAWKGGVTLRNRHGSYAAVKYVRCPTEYIAMARTDGYVMEHRIIVACILGRTLLRTEVVHHMNHDPTDNRQENLALFSSNKDHKMFEWTGSPSPIWQGSMPSTIAESSGA
jgi:hypothetical protein